MYPTNPVFDRSGFSHEPWQGWTENSDATFYDQRVELECQASLLERLTWQSLVCRLL